MRSKQHSSRHAPLSIVNFSPLSLNSARALARVHCPALAGNTTACNCLNFWTTQLIRGFAMRSSFVRKGAAGLQDPGTRPGLHGQTLVSSGVAGLDRLLGGGLPLGTVCVLLEDGGATQCNSLVRCFLGEGAACGQNLCWAAPGAQGRADSFIPAQQRTASSASSSAKQQQKEEDEDGGASLRIAWQYRRYIKNKAAADARQEANRPSSRSSSSRSSSSASKADWAHSFDLGVGIGAEALQGSKCKVEAVDSSDAFGGEQGLRIGVQGLLRRVEEGCAAEGGTRAPLSVGRFALQSLSHPSWRMGEQGVLSYLYWLRGAVRGSRCAALVTLDTRGFRPAFHQRAVHLADTVARVQALYDDSLLVALSPDPATAVGVVSLLRLPSAGALGVVPLGPEGTSWLLRYKRRRLVLEEMDIDPDAEQALAEASNGGSTMSMLCAAPAAKDGAGPLDF